MKSNLQRIQEMPRIKYPEKKKRHPRRVIHRKDLVIIRNKAKSDSFYLSDPWLRLRYRVLAKHGRSCQACGAEGLNVRIHVDHIKPRSRFPGLQLLESNLQVLCEPCNLGKGNWDETDWRPTNA